MANLQVLRGDFTLKFTHGNVTAHSGLAHLPQLTTIYMRGLLGARDLFTWNQVRNMVSQPWIRVRVRFNYIFLTCLPIPIQSSSHGVRGPSCGILHQGAASSRASSSRCGFPARSSSGCGLLSRASLATYSLGTALLPLLLQSGRCCALVLVGVVVSFWSRSCCYFFLHWDLWKGAPVVTVSWPSHLITFHHVTD
jgi:hypothetical protein